MNELEESAPVRGGQEAGLPELPKDDWIVEAGGPDGVLVGAWVEDGWYHFKRFEFSDLPNEFVSVEDLTRLGFYGVEPHPRREEGSHLDSLDGPTRPVLWTYA